MLFVFKLYILSFQIGFRLNNKVSVIGPIALFPKSVLSWNVKNAADITEESLSIFTILEPKLGKCLIFCIPHNVF